MSQNVAASGLNSSVSRHSTLVHSASSSPSSLHQSSPSVSWNHGPHTASSSHASVPVSDQSISGLPNNSAGVDSVDVKESAISRQNSIHSGSTLKEHDLLGLSEVCSTTARLDEGTGNGLHGDAPQELTELRLGPPEASTSRKEDAGYIYQRVSEQGHSAAETGSFLSGLNVASTIDQSTAGTDKNASTSEQKCGIASTTSQAVNVDVSNSGTCRQLIESESLKKWHAEDGSDRNPSTEGLTLGMSISQHMQAGDGNRSFVDKSSKDGLPNRADDVSGYQERTWQDRSQHVSLQGDLSSQDTVQDRLEKSAQERHVSEMSRPERVKHEGCMTDKRPQQESPALSVHQPVTEQRYAQDISCPDRSPRMSDFAAHQKHWHAIMAFEAPRAAVTPDYQSPQVCHPVQELDGSRAQYSSTISGYPPQGSRVLFPKSGAVGAKRGFSEALGSVPDLRNGFQESRTVLADGRGMSIVVPSSTAVSSGSAHGVPSDAEGKAMCQQQAPKLQHPMYQWVKPMPQSWQISGLEQQGGSLGPFPSTMRPTRTSTIAKPVVETGPPATDSNSKGWETHAKSLQDSTSGSAPKTPAASESKHASGESRNGPTSESGAASIQRTSTQAQPAAVGWPPLRSFRKNTLAVQPRPSDCQPRPIVTTGPVNSTATCQSNSLFVKVYMDGVPIGRKVDLRSNSSYEKLSSALEEMFLGFVNVNGKSNGQAQDPLSCDSERNFLYGSDYVLTYEDQDRDLMLVGDVPWNMFIESVKRLRIMKGSEAIGLGTRAAEKVKSKNIV